MEGEGQESGLGEQASSGEGARPAPWETGTVRSLAEYPVRPCTSLPLILLLAPSSPLSVPPGGLETQDVLKFKTYHQGY